MWKEKIHIYCTLEIYNNFPQWGALFWKAPLKDSFPFGNQSMATEMQFLICKCLAREFRGTIVNEKLYLRYYSLEI